MTVAEMKKWLDDFEMHGFGSREVEIPEALDENGFLVGKPVKTIELDRGTGKVYIQVSGGLV